MKGNNTLIFNQATMIEAVQFYLNAQMVNASKVTSVKTGGSVNGDYFKIEITDTVGDVEK